MAPITSLVRLATRSLDSGPTIIPPLQATSFTLDSSGLAGFFGGDGAVQGMSTVHLFEGRRWLGWYNTPGSYEIAKQYGQLARALFWDGLFPGPEVDPAHLFALDGRSGPRFLAAHSGSSFQHSGHLAYLVARKARGIKRPTPIRNTRRPTLDCTVTMVSLDHAPALELPARRRTSRRALLAAAPILASVAACVLCALGADWWCCMSIASGILASGVACFVIGSAHLMFSHPQPATGAPPGDGVLLDDKGIIVLRGEEGAVNAVTRGRFSLTFASEPRYGLIGVCSIGLTVQFLVQLLLIPQGTLFGQVMFVATLAISWMYNVYLAALDKEDIQTDILQDVLCLNEADHMKKFVCGTRTAQVVFAALLLHPPQPVQLPTRQQQANPKKLFDELLPNNTPVWERWKKVVVGKLRARKSLVFAESDWKVARLTPEDQGLLRDLFNDAQEAWQGWCATVCKEPGSDFVYEEK